MTGTGHLADDFLDMHAWQIAAGVLGRKFTAMAVTEAFLARIVLLNPQINAFTCITSVRALKEAARVDALIAEGTNPGPLAGVPFSAKNLFDLRGLVTLAGSSINADYPPATQDATSVERMCAAGAICLGATNMGEYAYDFTTRNAHYGATYNPLDQSRSAGGSSGGSAASVLANLCSLSLGTDTNGSMRVPASFCGIWSLKPGYGRLSRAGSFPFVSSLDTIGVFGKSVRDLAIALDVMSGPDSRDSICQSHEQKPVGPELEMQSEPLRVARLGGYFVGRSDPVIDKAVDVLCKALGTDAVVELPKPELARAAAFLITAAEGGALHKGRLAERAADFDQSTRARFLAGSLTPSAWYLQGQRFRSWWKAEVAKLFVEQDILIAPATPMLAPKLTDVSFQFGDTQMALGPNIGLYTQPITLVGLPVLTAPVLIPGSLPTGIQLVGRPNAEKQLLQLAYKLEQAGICAPASMVKGH